jgi:hypothetical protein
MRASVTPGENNPPISSHTSPESAPNPAAPPRGWLWRLAGRIVPVENPAGAVYGLLAIGALLAAESGRHETYLDTVLSAAIAACVYWLLHAYATVLGRRLSSEERLSARALMSALAHDRALLRGAAIPISVLLLAWAGGAAQRTAVSLALWSAVASLVTFELLAGVRARASARELMLEAAVGLALGLAVLSLKIVLH